MASAPAPSPPEASPAGNARVTRQDWIDAAMAVLIRDGAEAVKIKPIGERLGVARSSFYWYFDSRQALLDGLLAHWQGQNTAALTRQAALPAPTITAAVCNVFRCALDTRLFNTDLDLTIRDWARRSAAVRRMVNGADIDRLAALTAMFKRYGYEELDAETRAGMLYFGQIGYGAAELDEPLEARLRLVPTYLRGFTGREPLTSEVEDFIRYSRAVQKGDPHEPDR